MFVGCLKADIFIPYSRSLKDKRRVIRRIKHKVRNNFNVSVAEKPSDKWQTCELSFVCVNYAKDFVDKTISSIEKFISLDRDVQLVGIKIDVI
ncbi:MAG: hypothetical protein B1H08_03155 [Candidatus Omnitrophica bacterium 4484_171]|nr:MAG: hypothetical protein B1H08_03155 [Candidatus Omnitrophica bacterium 4484_171]